MRVFTLTCIFFSFILSHGVLARPRSEGEAYALAKRYFDQHALPGGRVRAGAERGAIRLAHAAWREGELGVRARSGAEPAAYYYIYSRGQGDGFVIVAGDDAYGAYIGYSDRGTLDEATMPPPVRDYLAGWREAMAHGAARVEPAVRAGLPERVEPLMPDIKWGQGEPWNAKTPIKSGRRCPVGCGATAMTQIMRYYEWPPRGKGTFEYEEYYDRTEHSANFNVEYKWDDMPVSYDDVATATPAERDALSTLAVHVGFAMQTTYYPSGSGSFVNWMTEPMSEFFSYDDEIKFLRRWEHEDGKWHEIIRKELAAGRPVVYRGQAPQEAHFFVLDGYDAEGKFRVNWGWNGNSDGYYSLDLLQAPGWYHYSERHYAIVGIKPKGTVPVTSEQEGEGTLSITGYGTLAKVPYGRELTVQAEAKPGWELSALTVNGKSVESGYKFKARRATVVKAVFARKQGCSVSVLYEGEGTVRLYQGSELLPQDAQVGVGTALRVEAEPAAGWRLLRITANGVDITASGSLDVQEDVRVQAVFVPVYHKLGVSQAGEGTVSLYDSEGAVLDWSRVDTVRVGSALRVEAEPAAGWRLLRIMANGADITASGSLEVQGDVRVQAVFVPVYHKLGVSQAGEGTVRLYDGEGAVLDWLRVDTVRVGSALRVEAEPAAGWRLLRIMANGADITASGSLEVQGDVQVQAVFVPVYHKLAVSQAGEGRVHLYDRGGAVLDWSRVDTVRMGIELRVEAEPAEGWRLDALQVNGESVASGTWLAARGAMVFDARFARITYSVVVEPSAGGTLRVGGYEALDRVPHGTRLTLEAVAETGYALRSVKVNGVELAVDATELIITSDAVLQAEFSSQGGPSAVGYDRLLSVVPNPACEAVRVLGVGAEELVTLHTLQGRTLLRWRGGAEQRVDGLPEGVYLLRVGARVAPLVIAR